jgi:hypothetical protein
MAVRFLAIVAVVTATAVAFAPPSRTLSQYVSALSDLAASPILAANPHCHGTCEFVAPGYTCLNESSGTRYRKSSTGGCSTITC